MESHTFRTLNSQPSTVEITTGARLHFGLLSHNPRSRRQFGGVGLMIDAPRVQISVGVGDHDVVEGSPDVRVRGEEFLVNYRAACPRSKQPPNCRIRVRDEIPPHAGLGSGTQLGMAISKALALLAGDANADSVTLASRVRRGTRSALGVHGFGRGGFLVDGGKVADDVIGTLAVRTEFPADWRLVLVTPAGEAGLSGAGEREAFSRLPPMPQATTDLLCRITLMELLPAVVEADFAACSEAIFRFGCTVGQYFAPIQGGTYACPSMTKLVESLGRQGFRGIAQTSWGPTIFILCEDELMTDDCRSKIEDWQSAIGDRQLAIRTAAPMNRPAIVDS